MRTPSAGGSSTFVTPASSAAGAARLEAPDAADNRDDVSEARADREEACSNEKHDD